MNPFDPTTSGDETDWLAVRYVLGELPADSASAFEERLAEDQPAREAVARATRLIETLAVVPRVEPAAPIRRMSLRRVAAIAATIAAAVLLGVVLRHGGDDAGPRLASEEVDPTRLVVLWSEAAEPVNGDAYAESADEADSDEALLPPDWLLAAVEQEAMSPDADPALDLESDQIETN